MPDSIKNQFLPVYSDLQVSNSKYKYSARLSFHLIWLLLCVYLIYTFGIEKNKGFDKAVFILSGGFILYMFLPISLRKIVLLLFAFAIEIYLLGIFPATGVLAIILFFVALTYIPNFSLRNILALIFTGVGAFFIMNGFANSMVRITIMYGSVFLMLRYIFLLYELRYFKNKPVFIDRLCYLFMLPQACFPLFPIVDPKLFFSRFYSQPAQKSLEQGLKWITRGILHTLIYRFVYLYLTPSPYEIESFWNLILFIFSGYSLILRLSGLFYISLGFLTLFGFSLPEIFDNYFFATSFPDLWRRINLYWRDFITRVFYYPVLFKLKKIPIKMAILLTTLFMFFCTWFFHNWQWLWIKGKFVFNPNDILFWCFLGITISTSSVLFLKEFDKVKIKKSNSLEFVKKGASVIFMLVVMGFLWSFWTSNSITEWWYLLSFVKTGSLWDILIFSGAIILFIAIASIIRYLYDTKKMFGFVFKEFTVLSGIICNSLLIILFFILQSSSYRTNVLNFAHNNLNNKDRLEMERGYYEQLLNNDDKAIDLFNIKNENKKWNLDNLAYFPVNNILIKEFKPNFRTVFKGDSLSTNQFGLRDKEYSPVKDSGTIRIALLGGSYEMGSGVSNNENFASLFENEINKYSKSKIEILNFGAGGYHLLQNVYVTLNKIKNIKPDYLFYFAHTGEVTRSVDNFVNVIEKGKPLSFNFLDSIYSSSGVNNHMCRLEKNNKIKPFGNEMVSWGYKTIADYCKQNNIFPVFIYLPANASLRKDKDKSFCFKESKNTGFEIIDLEGVYQGNNPETIQLSIWDAHPNKKGHKVIADKLLEEILNNKQKFKFLK